MPVTTFATSFRWREESYFLRLFFFLFFRFFFFCFCFIRIVYWVATECEFHSNSLEWFACDIISINAVIVHITIIRGGSKEVWMAWESQPLVIPSSRLYVSSIVLANKHRCVIKQLFQISVHETSICRAVLTRILSSLNVRFVCNVNRLRMNFEWRRKKTKFAENINDKTFVSGKYGFHMIRCFTYWNNKV